MKDVAYHSKFYKADRRELVVTDSASIYKSTGEVISLEDVFIKPGKSIVYGEHESPYVLIPVAGSLEVAFDGRREMIHPEELYAFRSGTISVSNYHASELINILKIGLPEYVDSPKKGYLTLNQKNVLCMVRGIDVRLSVGVFDSRSQIRYESLPQGKGLYAFVINGSFEVEERLVEYRDALLLKGYKRMEFESLSENAILLVLEY